jgi:hypothetical protein
MTLLTPHKIKRIYGLRDLHEHPEESRRVSLEDDWDNRAGLVLWLTDNGKSASVWQDSSGAGNNGTVYGATTPPAATPGALGYVFDGTDDYIDCGSAANLDITDTITVSVWVKLTTLTSVPDNGFGLLMGGDYFTRGYRLAVESVTGKVYFQFRGGGGNSTNTTYALSTQTWYHITIAYNRTNVFIYVNSANMAQGNYSAPIDYTGAHTLKIGVSDLYTPGIINDVRIYNRALEQKEITSYFQHTRGKYGV